MTFCHVLYGKNDDDGVWREESYVVSKNKICVAGGFEFFD